MDQKADVELLYEDTVSAEGIEEFERRVAERIRSLRQQRGLTLQKLAERARVSKSMISKVERGEASPSAGTMSRLADGLGVSIATLLGEYDRHRVTVQRMADQPLAYNSVHGWTRRTLSPVLPSNGLDIVLMTIPEGGCYGPIKGHPYGVNEHVVIVKGQIAATIGNVEHVLDCGDSMCFQAHVDHLFRNVGGEEAKFYAVIQNNNR